MNPRRGWSWVLTGAVVAAVLMTPMLQKGSGEDNGPELRELAVHGACDPVRDTCLAEEGGATIQFRVETDPRPLQPFPVMVALEGVAQGDVLGVLVGFSMAGMDMGPNRFRLTRDADGHWRGEVTLPICTSGRTDWIARVEAIGSGAVFTASFPLALSPAG